MIRSQTKILITGGGSGGHISVSKALITALINDFNIPTENIIYVGGDLGMENEKYGNSLEMKIFKDINIKKYYIRAGKLQRKISFKTLSLLLRTILGFFDSISLISKEKPNLVISTGGFVSVPVCIVSKLFSKPIYLHEQTASVGLANKIVGRFAKKIYVAFLDSKKYFKEDKVKHIGNIVRKEIFKKEKDSETDQEIVGLVEESKNLPFVYISGGSLGSHILNEKVLSQLEDLLSSFKILLQTGSNEVFSDYKKALERKDSLLDGLKQRFVVKEYIHERNIGYVLNSMDIFVGRSGANTVYEIGVLKKYALFIPIPWVTNNEQYLNAKVLESTGNANILEEKYLNQSSLRKEIEKLLEQKSRKRLKSDKLERLFPTNATHSMLEDIFKEI